MKSIVTIVFILVNIALASHYRGSMISWRIVNTTSTSVSVELLQRHTWHYYTAMCNDSQIAAGNKKIGSGTLECASSCPTNVSVLASVAVPCTSYNLPENYTSGEGRIQVILPVNWTLTAVFNGAGWFSLLLGGGNWSVAVEINTHLRSNGKYNQAPIITMLPIIRLKRNQTYNVYINVADNDFDPYQCLWSTTIAQCGGVCMKVPISTVLNSTSCILKFNGPLVGYYAIALTVVDFESTTSSTPLSSVPIQFLFKIWDSNNSCILPPLYLGDVPPNQCIYVEPGQVLTMRVLIRIQCLNATLDNIIASYPSGFTQSPTYLDPYDSTVNIFMINYTARVEQIGQNLFCFAGVDSIGNQADTTCLRFTVQQGTSSMNTLYLTNATRYPTGTASKSQSIWTMIYPNGSTYSRAQVNVYIRFKRASTQVDYLTINVATSTNVNYQSDRITFTTSLTFTPGESFYISFDPGVFLATSTCLRDSMGITDTIFWTFNIPSEPNTTQTTTPTTTTAVSTVVSSRTSPILRTLSSTSMSTSHSLTIATLVNIIFNDSKTTSRSPSGRKDFPIGGIVGIILGSMLFILCLFEFIPYLYHVIKPLPKTSNLEDTEGLTDAIPQYRIVTRKHFHKTKKYELPGNAEHVDITTSICESDMIAEQLVEIQC